MIPEYVDISHFRAPYKNVEAMMGYGQNNGSQSSYVTTDSNGYMVVKPELGPTLEMVLLHHTVFPIASDKGIAVQLVRYTAENLALAASMPEFAEHLKQSSAYNWAKGQVQAGMVVLAPITTVQTLLSGAVPPYTPGADQMYSMRAGTPEAIAAAKGPMGIVIAGDPGKTNGESLTTPGEGASKGIGVISVALITGGAVALYLLLKRQ